MALIFAKVNKILIVRFSSIGDIVLTTPVIRNLRRHFPEAEIHFLTKKAYLPVLEHNPYINKVYLLGKDNYEELLNDLHTEEYDFLVDLHHNLRTFRLKRNLGTRSASFPKLNIQKWLLVNLKVNAMPPQHIVGRYMKTVERLGVKNDGQGLDYFLSEKDEVKPDDIPMSHHAGYLALVIGATYATKKLPLHKLQELCSLLDHPIILLGGPEDAEMGNQIASVDSTRVYNACGKFSLNESASLVKQSKLVITHDTGLMHIAAAFRKPIISIWGNTVPEFGMYPYYGEHAVWQAKMEVMGLSCRPCSKIGYQECPKKHFKCMANQDLNKLTTLIRQFLQGAGQPG